VKKTLLCAIVGILVVSPAAAQTVDTIALWNGATGLTPFGIPAYGTYGQTFTVTQGAILQRVDFLVGNCAAGLDFRFELYAWDGAKATGPAIRESSVITLPTSPLWSFVSVTTRVALVPGEYVLFASTARDQAGAPNSVCNFAAVLDPATYTGGRFVFLNSAANPNLWTGTTWGTYPADLAIRAVMTPASPAGIDFSNDFRTDFAVVRNTGGGALGDVTWLISDNVTGVFTNTIWGNASDWFVPADYDGDGKTDVAIWRPGPVGTAGFWIKYSSTGATGFTAFGQTGDDPRVVGDYDGDGKVDMAVYRSGASAGLPSFWYYVRSSDGMLGTIGWGQYGDTPAPGDYDGDGKFDAAVRRDAGGGFAQYWLHQSTAGDTAIYFGTPTDRIVPGDFDGDKKTDLAVVRSGGGTLTWWVRRSSTGVVAGQTFGLTGDNITPGDYDGDGRTDFSVWRSGTFWVSGSWVGVFNRAWGVAGDFPIASFNVR